ncbi:MAG: DNA topoisomerase IV subunit A, partial [Lentisphaeria bacterium]|nr:DNA topoisomerase IV subunit A [Lentisphaeria bacterium]
MSDGEELRPGDLPETPPVPVEEENETGPVAAQKRGTNEYFRKMMDRNFLDYASYVIGSRAIPDVDDGLKPVQRRILWALYLVYDGRTQKVANIVGNTMHFHPHGDASIGDALVVLANKGGCIEQEVADRKTGKKHVEYLNTPYYIKKQGNFGNILTGSPAAAGRYTECALTKLAYETLFNNDITDFVPNYDGREVEPVVLPAKVPSLLMLGSDGIAVGMSTTILPHNFNELIDAEIAALRGESFQLFPDFQQGGLMDASEYDDGNGRIVLRAKIDIEGRDLVIREIPYGCTTESLVGSIERAAEKNKIRVSNIADFTTDHVEIRVTPTRGYDPEKTLNGLYMYTDCSVSISPKMMVIRDRRPVQMSVSEVVLRNVDKLKGYLKRELELELERQIELRHAKTLAQIFFENRICKRIEE